jgi:energy-coupling factor transporter ATP-binding protein EcfA2
MYTVNVTLKNYRIFKDPVRFSIGNHITAILGPNNSGKSTALKLFYEFRNIITGLQDLATFKHAVSSGDFHGGSYPGVDDAEELFNNDSDGPTTVEFSICPDNSECRNETHLLDFSFTRNRGSESWHFSFGQVKKLTCPRVQLNVDQDWIVYGITKVANFSIFKDFASKIGKSIYFGSSRTLIHASAGQYLGQAIGTDFINTWNQWKNGVNKAQNQSILRITDDIQRIFGFKRLDINSSADNRSMRLIIDGKTYSINEMGSGIGHFIYVLGQAAIQRPEWIFIDEPETALHPALQIDFVLALASYAKFGTAYTSHAIGLAKSVSDKVYSLYRENGIVRCHLFEGTKNFAEFLGQMSYASLRELGFDKLLLVEGTTELKTISQFMRLLGKMNKVLMLPLGGSSMIGADREHELAELKRISENVFVLIDSEKKSATESLAADRVAFLNSCAALGFKAIATEKRATENYLSERAIKEVKGDKYSALAEYEKLGSAELGWAKSDNWKIANKMTKEEIIETDLGRFLESI